MTDVNMTELRELSADELMTDLRELSADELDFVSGGVTLTDAFWKCIEAMHPVVVVINGVPSQW
jgi:hypothetical protein